MDTDHVIGSPDTDDGVPTQSSYLVRSLSTAGLMRGQHLLPDEDRYKKE